MSKISKEKQEKIMSNILAILYEHSPQPLFTSEISKLELRDEEFIKRLLFELKAKGLIIQITKNPKGTPYLKRARWKLTNQAYEAYKGHQN